MIFDPADRRQMFESFRASLGNPSVPYPSEVWLVASGDQRLPANQICWEVQAEMEQQLEDVLQSLGVSLVRGHAIKPDEGHGFIALQREGLEVFRHIPPEVPLIVAEAVWQYSHHVLPGLTTHTGPILTVANWSGQYPGLVGLLNLNGSLTKAGVRYSSLWSESFRDDAYFRDKLRDWLEWGVCNHDASHVHGFDPTGLSPEDRSLATRLADTLKRDKTLMGVFDEGCMGMFNAIIPDHLLNRVGVFKERLSQSALYFETTQVDDDEARSIRTWLDDHGMTFHFGEDPATELTEEQVHGQCKMYIAATRLADDFGCELIGIQYQQGLKDILPASDLVEGMLNNAERPPVMSRDGQRELFAGRPLVHFNEVDECAGLDGLLIQRVHAALDQPLESTLHDIRWGDRDASGTTDEYVWVFEISGAAPPAHFVNGWRGAEGWRQPMMYFPYGGSSVRGVSKPGAIVWSRIYVEEDALHLDMGRGNAIALPEEETQRRWEATTREWPIMHATLRGVSRDQLMARHKSNHIQVCYADSEEAADRALRVRAAMAESLGLCVHVCGD